MEKIIRIRAIKFMLNKDIHCTYKALNGEVFHGWYICNEMGEQVKNIDSFSNDDIIKMYDNFIDAGESENV